MKNHVLRRLFAAVPVAVSLLLVPALKATPLLTAVYEAQLEAWLGQGDLVFSNVFTKQAGATGLDFHTAADGQRATFTLMNIFGSGANGSFALPSQIIGGYNPQSWNSSGLWNYTYSDAERTAFLYNLSSGTIQRQNLQGQGDGVFSGLYQTFNYPAYVDAAVNFGWSDLWVGGTGLNFGSANNYSYGGTSFGDEILTGGSNYSGTYSFNVGELEVWRFSTATNAVPDTAGPLGLLGVSLLALAAFRRRVCL